MAESEDATMADAEPTKGSRKASDIAQSPPRNNKEAAKATAVTPNTKDYPELRSDKRQRGHDQDIRSYLGAPPPKEGATGTGATADNNSGSQNEEGNEEEEEVDFSNMTHNLVPKGTREAVRLQRKMKHAVASPPGIRKTTISFADQQRKKTWRSKRVVSIAIKTPYNKEGAKHAFDAKLIQMLTFMREQTGKGKSDAVILPRPKALATAQPIATMAEIPTYIASWERDYAEITSKSFSQIRQGQSRTIRCSVIMGFNADADSCIRQAEDDLQNMGINISIKPCQELATDSNIAFFGLPIKTETCTVKRIVDENLQALETELMVADPDNFPKWRHGKAKWVNYEVIKSFPMGMPWEKYDPTKPRTPNGRLAFVFQVAREDSQRFSALLQEAKAKNLWYEIFGEAAFTVQMIPTYHKDEDVALTSKRDAYITMVQTHGSVQLSMGSATIEGLIRPMDKFTLRRTDSNGEKIKTIKKSAHAIMRYMKLDGEKVWLSTIPNSDGSVTGNFSSVLDGFRNYVGKWLRCPAA